VTESFAYKLEDCENDFDILRVMFEKMRADRDRWRNIANDLYGLSIRIIGEHMTTPEIEAFEQAVYGD